MENKSNVMNEWQCFSMTSLKDVQFAADFNMPASEDAEYFKIHYFLSQPLIFGSAQKGVMSFIVTGNSPKDDFPETNRRAMVACLDRLVENSTITNYRLKEIDREALRVSLIYSVNFNEPFGEKMIKTVIAVFKELNVCNGSSYKAWIDQMNFVYEYYHCINSIWLKSKDFFSSNLGFLQLDELIDELGLYRADTKDLF